MKKVKKPENKHEKELTIKLKMPRFCAEQMVGALRLGMATESICAHMVMNSLQTFDTHSMKYGGNIAWIIKQISKQTKITRRYESCGYAYPEPLAKLFEFADKEAIRGEKAYRKYERAEHKRVRDIEKKLKKKLGRKPTQEEIVAILEEKK